jgi:hypothetical protein
MNVFISHGHDELVRATLAEFVTREGHRPVVLKQAEAPGQTIVEKLEATARDIDCALVVLTSDDQTSGGTKRARQNVIHELGYFHALLRRERVVVLVEKGVDWLSNLGGLGVIEFDPANLEAAFYRLHQALSAVAELRRGAAPAGPPALKWTLTAPDPTALVRLYRGQSPIIHGANEEFLDLFEHSQGVPHPDSGEPLTIARLIENLGRHGRIADPASLAAETQKFFERMFLPQPPEKTGVPLVLKGHPRFGNRSYHLYLIGRGVVDELETSAFVSCLIVYQEDPSGLHLGRVSLESLQSQNVVTVVLSRGGSADKPASKVASGEAARFYGYAGDNAERLKGKTLEDLLDILRRYMDPDDYERFRSDQTRVSEDYGIYGRAWARVPIKFNNRHPDDGFRNKEFYPIISHSIVEKGSEADEHYVHVLYVNLPLLLENLPRGAGKGGE